MAEVPHNPKTLRQVIEGASRAVGKIDMHGLRGITGLSITEIEDMALALVALGLIATPPGEAPPDTLILTRKEAQDGQ
ncbi:MAG: hypothetical protein MUE52_04280 [Tabrizicola sp.]|jgi:hypothetical protein|nr:hypothetical protein [Tabrizicola sp.]